MDCFYFEIAQYLSQAYTPYTFQANIRNHSRVMDSNHRVVVYFARVDINLQTITLTIFCNRFFFFILISLNTKVPQILHIKFHPYILSRSGENADFIGFAIFSVCGNFGLFIRLHFIILKCWSLITVHVQFEIHGCTALRE